MVDPGGQSVSATDRLYLAAAMPTLIVWGSADTIIPASHAHSAHEAIPGSRLELFTGCGHFPHVQEPIRFADLLHEFITTTEPSPTSADDYREILVEHAVTDDS